MNAELIAVGTEILLGDIVNTDAQLISQGLSELGINVFYQTVVGDNPARLERVVREAKDRADIIITTGGLGPTLDDLTKETLATVFGKKMVLHQPSMDRLTDFFKTIGREMTKNNEKQAWLPEGCTVFTNLWGTAPGCAFEARRQARSHAARPSARVQPDVEGMCNAVSVQAGRRLHRIPQHPRIRPRREQHGEYPA